LTILLIVIINTTVWKVLKFMHGVSSSILNMCPNHFNTSTLTISTILALCISYAFHHYTLSYVWSLQNINYFVSYTNYGIKSIFHLKISENAFVFLPTIHVHVTPKIYPQSPKRSVNPRLRNANIYCTRKNDGL